KNAAKPEPDYTAAMQQLDQAQVVYDKAQLQKKMERNEIPTKDELQALMNQPGGQKELDDLAIKVGAKVNQEVFAAVLEARFKVSFTQYKTKHKTDGFLANIMAGLRKQFDMPEKDLDPSNLADKAAPDKSIKQLYTLLLKVPAKHGKDNEKLAEIIHFKANEP